MADWDAESFEFEEPDLPIPIKKAVVADKWEGEDEEEDVKDNWDDEEEEAKKVEAKKAEAKVSEKKKLSEKIKEKERQDKLKKQQEEKQQEELTAEEQLEEKLRVKKLQEDADLELAKEAFGISSTTNSVTGTGIDAMCPSSKDEFTEFEKVLREKITQFEKSAHYSDFLDSLFRELCISLEVEDLKKVSNSLAALLSEKQKIEKQNKAGKKKGKKGVIAGGGLKAKMRDDIEYDLGGYAQDYEDFM